MCMCPCVTGHCCSAGRRRCDHTHQTIKTLRRVKERSAGPTAMTAQAQHSAHSHMTCRLPRRHHWSHEGDPTQSYSTPCQCQELQHIQNTLWVRWNGHLKILSDRGDTTCSLVPMERCIRNGRVNLQVRGMIVFNETQRRRGLLRPHWMASYMLNLNCKWWQAACRAVKSQQHPKASEPTNNTGMYARQ